MAEMTISKLIEEIEVYVDNCKSVGMLSGSMIKINREELITMLDEVQTRLPKDLAESKQIVKTKDLILADARNKADRIIKDAAKEAGGLIDNTEIVSLANMRANDILDNAKKYADDIVANAKNSVHAMQLGVLEYTQTMMDGLEIMYSELLAEEQKYFKSIIEKLQDKHKQVLKDKREIDIQLGYNAKKIRKKRKL